MTDQKHLPWGQVGYFGVIYMFRRTDRVNPLESERVFADILNANFDITSSLSDHVINDKARKEVLEMNRLCHCFGVNKNVDLPPQSLETETFKLLKLDHVGVGNQGNGDSNGKSKLNIEGIECGVQFESSEKAKQEWSFTLYDFDGHGRITKEDLASLLKALYDAVGSSIKLPPNGATTLKLRLSVGQDSPAQLQSVKSKPSSQRNKNINKAPKHKVREFSKLNNLTRTQVKCTNENQGHSGLLANHHPPSAGNQSEMRGQSSQQAATNHVTVPDPHQQLADLVQVNMESVQLRHLRKYHGDSRGKGQGHQKRQQRITGVFCPVTSACTVLSTTVVNRPIEDGADTSSKPAEDTSSAPKESQDRRNYYLDLAGIENNNSKCLNKSSIPAAVSSCVRPGSGNRRSRSQDVAVATKCDKQPLSEKCDVLLSSALEKCDNLQRENDRQGNKVCPASTDSHILRSRLLGPQDVIGLNRSPKTNSSPKGVREALNTNNGHSRFRPVSLPGPVPLTVLPDYHRRHRHREIDHGMAMQQVAQWIEREHACAIDADRVLVQRHDHHHVHEHHHHHHFHHHYEA